jgi:hypothetical protein
MTDPQAYVPPDPALVIKTTRKWLELAVIGLNLCPFAKSVFVHEQIRYVVSGATTEAALLADLRLALSDLMQADADRVETTLLIHPGVLANFSDYNDFLDPADALLCDMELDGVLQIASFHPDYQFAGTAPDDIENATNRSPWPILHLLRESSIDRAIQAFPDAADIFERNIALLHQIGQTGWDQLQRRIMDE